MDRRTPLSERIESAFLWIAAFSFANGIFLTLTMLLKFFPPTAPVAVGVVTIQHYAKAKDYFEAALYFVVVPLLTLGLRRIGSGILRNEQRRFSRTRGERHPAVALLFTAPFLLSPLLYLTTGKAGWVLLLPVAIAFAAPRLLLLADSSRWLRGMFGRALRPYHALLFAEAASWLVFRYIVAGRRIAHVPTLFLESVFAALIVALFWIVALLVSRLAEVNFAAEPEGVFARTATAAIPFVVLPMVALIEVPTTHAGIAVTIVLLVTALVALRIRRPMSPRVAWGLAAYLFLPLLVFSVSYASTAHLSYWVDLFHAGESLGPASDYLRGKAPYRGVYALHGMLQDGLLDAWLMDLFGRSVAVSIAREVVVAAFLGVSLWYLGLVVFDSIPLAAIVVAIGSWTTAENNRTFIQVAAVALFWNALRRRSRASAFAAGVLAGIAVFLSYEIGLYTMVGALLAAAVIAVAARFGQWDGLQPLKGALFFAAGCAAGAAPFIVYLASRGALAEATDVTFVAIPRVIDAVWSLPFPDIVSTFRKDLNLHTLADFVLWEKFHLILSPLTIVIAAVYYVQRLLRRRADMLDHALIVLTVFAAIAQRTAFGRAEFRHQYFAAYLIGPMLALLAVVFARTLRELWSDRSDGVRPFVAAVVAAVVPVIAVLFWIPDLVNARIDDMTNYQRRALRVQSDPHADEVWNRIEAVRAEIDTLTRRNEPIFDFSNQPAFYFFVDRPNPTRFYQVPIASPPEYQAEVIGDLERAKPRVLIRTSPEGFDEFDGVPNDLRAQAVSAYLDDCYRFYRSVRGVELWTRAADARPQPIARYLAKFRIPREKDVVSSARQRMVFPLVGTQAGATGNFWVSDLTLHNPWKDPIPVSLRFVCAGNSYDRRFELKGRQTVRWPDVVRSLFQPAGGVGTLWVGYREGRRPVAIVNTADVAHGGRPSVEAPLTSDDVAIAGSPRPELTIIGIPNAPAAGRRINIGVVNTGIIPATFRITARTAGGAPIGHPIESGVSEDDVWLVPNVEQEIGAPIGTGTTIQITAIAGSGVAFASLVDPSGDTQFVAAVPTETK